MAKKIKLNVKTCNKLLDFIYPPEKTMTDKEVRAELKRLKINMAPAIRKLMDAIEKRKKSRVK